MFAMMLHIVFFFIMIVISHDNTRVEKSPSGPSSFEAAPKNF